MFGKIPLPDVLSVFSILIPLVAGFFLLHRAGRDMQVFFVFIFLNFVSSRIVGLLAIHRIHNLWLGHLWTPIEYSFLILVFSYWQKNHGIRKALRWSIPAFILIWIATQLWWINPFAQIFNPSRSMSSIVLTLLAIFTIFQLTEDFTSSSLKDYRLWVSLWVLVYCSSNVLLFSLGSFVMIDMVWTLHSIANIVGNIGFAVSFLCLHPKLMQLPDYSDELRKQSSNKYLTKDI